jgi:hypothetical protein
MKISATIRKEEKSNGPIITSARVGRQANYAEKRRFFQ